MATHSSILATPVFLENPMDKEAWKTAIHGVTRVGHGLVTKQQLPHKLLTTTDQYMTTGKTIALSVWTFISKVMSLLYNTLSCFAIAFLPRS